MVVCVNRPSVFCNKTKNSSNSFKKHKRLGPDWNSTCDGCWDTEPAYMRDMHLTQHSSSIFVSRPTEARKREQKNRGGVWGTELVPLSSCPLRSFVNIFALLLDQIKASSRTGLIEASYMRKAKKFVLILSSATEPPRHIYTLNYLNQ